MASISEIYALIEDQSGAPAGRMRPDDNVCKAYGIDGDDFEDLIRNFGEKFSVDLSGYKWYFHHSEEGVLSLGGLLIAPPSRRVSRMPITPAMLLNFAHAGRWNLDYPAHKLPTRRYDLLLNQFILVAIAVGILVIWITRSFNIHTTP